MRCAPMQLRLYNSNSTLRITCPSPAQKHMRVACCCWPTQLYKTPLRQTWALCGTGNQLNIEGASTDAVKKECKKMDLKLTDLPAKTRKADVDVRVARE